MVNDIDPRRFAFYLSALRELGQSLEGRSEHLEKSKPLRESLYRIMGTFAFSRGVILMWNDEDRKLIPVCAKGLRPGKAFQCSITQKVARKLVQASEPFQPHLPPGGFESLTAQLRPASEKAELEWFIPMCARGGLIGLLLFGGRIGGRPLATFEMELLQEMVSLLALHIESGRTHRRLALQVREGQKLNRKLNRVYLETIRALSSVIDPPETDGRPTHSLRVAALAAEIAGQLKLKRDTQIRLYLAGLLHDIGKQMINRDILQKREKLSDNERREIEEHANRGWEVISHLDFPWGDVAQIIRHHHERLDGRGYPDRLRGEDLSIEARILMMAEAFDSMTSQQPWRPALSFDKIVAQIQENLGIQFEPKVVNALCRVVARGLEGDLKYDAFVPHLRQSFDPELVHKLLSELRQTLSQQQNYAAPVEVVSLDEID